MTHAQAGPGRPGMFLHTSAFWPGLVESTNAGSFHLPRSSASPCFYLADSAGLVTPGYDLGLIRG